VEGTIDSEPDPGRTTTRYRVAADNVTAGGGPVETHGGILVTLHQYAEFLPGDRVRVTGQLDEPPVLGDFDYRAYLLSQGVAGTMFMPRVEVLDADPGFSLRRWSAEWRLDLERTLRRALPEPEASL